MRKKIVSLKEYINNFNNKKTIEKYIIYFMLILVMFLSFYNNIFVTSKAQNQEFERFQKDSENHVVAAIIRDKYKLNDSKYGLQLISDVNVKDYETYKFLLEEGDNSLISKDYRSQVGIQGRIFSFLYNKLNVSIDGLHMVCSLLLAIVLINICRLLKEKYGRLLAIIFYLTFLLSPFIINFARNLYWVEFSWFLPLMFCLLLQKTKNIKLYVPMIFISVLFKCLCGYEYLSTILLAAISFLVVDFCINKKERKQNFKLILIVGIVSILAFGVALCLHANIRGNGNLFLGIKDIIERDVMKRTVFTNAELFSNPLIQQSINASYMTVIKMYFNFQSDILIGIDGGLFKILSILSLLIVIYNLIKNKTNSLRDFVLYGICLLSTLSWLILGKAHSYIHGMNFVLWYFGYIQMTIYVIIKFIINGIKNYKEENE